MMRASLADDDDSVFAELLESVAPAADDIVVLTKSYFDESYADSLLCVAGYCFTSRSARLIDKDWRHMLFHWRLPYFRMSACNARRPPFDLLSEDECIKVASEAISLIKKHATVGFAITIDEDAFHKIITDKGFVSTPYEACAWLGLAAAWTELNRRVPVGGMSFFFESGFKHESQANKMMKRIFSVPSLKAHYAYNSHTFIDKSACRPTQAADLLAWQWLKDLRRKQKGLKKPRGDLFALLSGTPHHVLHLDDGELNGIVAMLNRQAGSPLGNEIGGIALRNPSSPLFARNGQSGSQEAYDELKAQYPDRFMTPKS
jgi:hypothetical protein